mmetsp:Transcript_14702/g.21963  ORF Transcript_14702/g.21963 Transcript_14702/m.21963 type:complete len:257 (-) Transcript_14702:79-849(-)
MSATATTSTVGKTYCLLGGSGSVGQSTLNALVKNPQVKKILLANRRALTYTSEQQTGDKLKEIILDMDNLYEEAKEKLFSQEKVDAVLITMGVGAPSKSNKETLLRVDIELPTQFAKAAKSCETVKHVGLLTAVGADASSKESWISGTSAGGGLYNMAKGTVENNMIELKFDSTSLFRPSTIVGSANTPGVWASIAPAFDWMIPSKYQSIEIDNLAQAMVNDATTKFNSLEQLEKPHVDYFEGKDLFQLFDPSSSS